MKIRADEHISPKIIKAVQTLILTDGWDLSHVRDLHTPKTADETWVPKFASEGGNAILSGDRKMLAKPHQILAIIKNGLVGVFMSKQWSESKRHNQAANLLLWWPRIEIAISNSAPGTCLRVPFEFTLVGELENVTPNYAKLAAIEK